MNKIKELSMILTKFVIELPERMEAARKYITKIVLEEITGSIFYSTLGWLRKIASELAIITGPVLYLLWLGVISLNTFAIVVGIATILLYAVVAAAVINIIFRCWIVMDRFVGALRQLQLRK